MSEFFEGVELETRKKIFIRVSKIVGFLAIQDTGPTRVLFDGGGHIDVCGSASHWELITRIAVRGVGAPQSEENAA